VCVRCRRIRDIEMPEVDRLLDGRTSLGEFSLLGCSLEIDALCKQCRAQSARTKAVRSKPTKDRAYQ
jgi:Fe2+ or Zn2+ uptake regulation protein